MTVEDFLKFISTNLQYITIILVFFTVYLIKPLRLWLNNKIKKIVGLASIEKKLDDINDRINETNNKIKTLTDINNSQNDKIKKIEDKLDKHIKDDEVNKDIQKIQLRNELQQILNSKIELGNKVTIEEKQSIQELYNAYKSLQGNGVIDHLWNDFLAL